MKVWLLEKDKRSGANLIDQQKLETFVAEHSAGNIFQTFSMYQLYASVSEYRPTYLAVIDKNGDIQGLMLSCLIAEKGYKNFFSSRSIITGGPLVKGNSKAVMDLLLENYLKEISRKAIYSQCRNIVGDDHLKESFADNGFNYSDHFTIIIDLEKSPDDLFDSIHKKKRNNIKRALKRGVKIKKLSDPLEIQMAIDIIQATYRRIKIPGPPRSLLEKAINFFPGNVHFFGAFYGNGMVAAKIALGYKTMVYDWYSGYSLQYSYLCANDILTWNSVIWAKEEGFKIYDMGGAGKPGVDYGVRNFKIKFGGVLQNTGRYTQVHKTLLYLAGSSFIQLRSKMIKA